MRARIVIPTLLSTSIAIAANLTVIGSGEAIAPHYRCSIDLNTGNACEHEAKTIAMRDAISQCSGSPITQTTSWQIQRLVYETGQEAVRVSAEFICNGFD